MPVLNYPSNRYLKISSGSLDPNPESKCCSSLQTIHTISFDNIDYRLSLALLMLNTNLTIVFIRMPIVFQ